MPVLIGAFVGAFVMTAFPMALLVLGQAAGAPYWFHCSCCGWPIIGAAVGAAVAVRRAPGSGAGKGALTGLAAGFLGSIALTLTLVQLYGSLVARIDTLWKPVQGFLMEKKPEVFVKAIKDEARKEALTKLIIAIRDKKEPKDAYRETKAWLTPTRIDWLCEVKREKGETLAEAKKNAAESREFFEIMRTRSYEVWLEHLKKRFIDATGDLIRTFAPYLFSTVLLLSIFGGLFGGAFFAVDPTAVDKDGALPMPDSGTN